MTRRASTRATLCESLTPQALSRLEGLIGDRVLDLSAIASVVKSDSALLARMSRVLREGDGGASAFPSVEECIVELGAAGMRECLRATIQD